MLDLAERDRAFIIAEAGTCPLGDQQWAQSYVNEASRCGADAIKFQIFNNPIKDDMFCWVDGDEARQERWKESAMPRGVEDWRIVKHIADALDIMFLASVFQHSTVEWLNELGVEATKVASRAAKDFPYGKAPEPYLISAGMYSALLEDWDSVPDEMRGRWIRLQCEAEYPSTATWVPRQTNWDLPNEFWPGYSDHSGTPWRAIDAIARGCPLIEVHFYINEEDAGPDLPASLSLDELKLICEARDAFAEIRNAA